MENKADIFAKNVDAVSLYKHVNKLCEDNKVYEWLKNAVVP